MKELGMWGRGSSKKEKRNFLFEDFFFRQFCFLFASRDRFSSALKGCGGGGGRSEIVAGTQGKNCRKMSFFFISPTAPLPADGEKHRPDSGGFEQTKKWHKAQQKQQHCKNTTMQQ